MPQEEKKMELRALRKDIDDLRLLRARVHQLEGKTSASDFSELPVTKKKDVVIIWLIITTIENYGVVLRIGVPFLIGNVVHIEFDN